MYTEEHDVTGLDISPKCVEIMKERHPHGNWLVGDIRNPNLPDAEYDTVIASHILEHFFEQAPILKHMNRLARPGGKIIIVLPRKSFDPDHVHPIWNRKKIEQRILTQLKDGTCKLKARDHWIIEGGKTATASVVMIAWSPNRTRYILTRNSLRDERAYTRYEHKFVVVDNGPAEQTEMIRSANPDIHIVNNILRSPAESRNMGAGATDSDFIAFIDNDVALYDGWLTDAISILNDHPRDKMIIAPGITVPRRYKKKFIERIENRYDLYSKAGGLCLIMRRAAYNDIGRWADWCSTEDHEYSVRASAKGYSYVHDSEGKEVRHAGEKKSSFNYKHRLIDGVWTSA